jgi:hypothetical protein
MANLKLKNPAGGSLNFVSADGASDLTVTFPATTGTAMVSGNMPAFYAYLNQAQSPSVAWTKVQMNAEVFDTASCYDTSSYRFTPNVAGYYQFNLTVYQGVSLIEMQASIYKNGSGVNGVYGPDINSTYGVNTSSLMYMNGTTDYVEPYIYLYTSKALSSGFSNTFFNGSLVRAA